MSDWLKAVKCSVMTPHVVWSKVSLHGLTVGKIVHVFRFNLIKLKLSSSLTLYIREETCFLHTFPGLSIHFSPSYFLSFSSLFLSNSGNSLHFNCLTVFSCIYDTDAKGATEFFLLLPPFFEALITFRSTESPGHNLIMAYRQKKK